MPGLVPGIHTLRHRGAGRERARRRRVVDARNKSGHDGGVDAGAPLTNHSGLWEVRSSMSDRRIARVFFTVSGRTMLLLHGFIKKTRTAPRKELMLAQRRMKEHDRHV